MPRNGSGTYSAPSSSWNPPVNGTLMDPTDWQALLADLVAAMTASIAKDGQTTPTANLPMGGFRLTNHGAGAAAGQPLVYLQSAAQLTSLSMIAGRLNLAQGSDIDSAVAAGTLNLDAVLGNVVDVTGTTAVTAVTLAQGSSALVRFTGALTLTNGASLVLPGAANITTAAGDFALFQGYAAGVVRCAAYLRASGLPVVLQTETVLRGCLDGCLMSTAGSSTTMSIAAGQAANSTAAAYMTLAAALAKTTSAWVVGDAVGGKAETGAAANNTWYHFYLIRRPDTGVVDVCFSTSATGLTAASYVAGGGNVADAYTQFRRIGSGRTNGSAQWIKFTQAGDEFYWDTPPTADFNAAGSIAAANVTLTVPTGVKVKAFLNLSVAGGGGGAQQIYLSDPSNADVAPNMGTGTPLATLGWSGAASSTVGGQANCWTNTSAQIRHRELNTNTVAIVTLGWLDQRGQNA